MNKFVCDTILVEMSFNNVMANKTLKVRCKKTWTTKYSTSDVKKPWPTKHLWMDVRKS
jgi:hypothetical protein